MKNLYKRYADVWDKTLPMHAGLKDSKNLTNPLLLKVPDGWHQASTKIMFFGQETNDWGGIFGESNLDSVLGSYADFYLSGDCFKRYGGWFWNGIARLKQRIKSKYPDSAFLWNNVVKLGLHGEKGCPPDSFLQVQDEWFSVIAQEVELLEPDIVLFFCGPSYDRHILKAFQDAAFSPATQRPVRQLAFVSSSKLPEKTLRTYHPQYLYSQSIDDYLDDIFKAIL